MKRYLGEIELSIEDIEDTEYFTYETQDWVLYWIVMYGGIDGAHHKDWLLDQIARILKGTEVILKMARWDDGTEEERFNLAEPTKEYLDWVKTMEPNYYEGIAP